MHANNPDDKVIGRFTGTDPLPAYPPRLTGKFHQMDYKMDKPRRATLSWGDVREIREQNKFLQKDWDTNRRARYLKKYLRLPVSVGAIRSVLLNQTFCELKFDTD